LWPVFHQLEISATGKEQFLVFGRIGIIVPIDLYSCPSQFITGFLQVYLGWKNDR
jgi:hypothetical protein